MESQIEPKKEAKKFELFIKAKNLLSKNKISAYCKLQYKAEDGE